MKEIINQKNYLEDGELYSLWKYCNGYRLVDRSGTLNFDDLTPSGENYYGRA